MVIRGPWVEEIVEDNFSHNLNFYCSTKDFVVMPRIEKILFLVYSDHRLQRRIRLGLKI